MRRVPFGPLIAIVVGLAALPLDGQVRRIDAERLLADRFAFTPAEISQARGGQAVAKLLPSTDANDVGVLAAVRIDSKADRLAFWLKDIASFRKAAELGIARRLSNPPQIGDFADLSLDEHEISALESCRPGNCDLRLGDAAIQQFQTQVDWAAADAPRRANLLTRQLLMGHAQAYLKGGDAALGAAHNEKHPRLAADEFRAILNASRGLYDIAPPLAAFLERFPAATLPGADHFLYWGKGGVGTEASISLRQLIIYTAPDGAILVVDKQLYASRYTDAALAVISLAPAPNGAGFYALVGARARSTMLTGVGARMLRGRVEKATRETAEMYLNWIRASLTM